MTPEAINKAMPDAGLRHRLLEAIREWHRVQMPNGR